MPRTHSLQLLFDSPKKKQMPGDAIARIGLRFFTRERKNGAPLVTCDCMTIGELRFQVRRLKRELDIIERQGAKQFAAYDKRLDAWRNSVTKEEKSE